MEIPEDKQKEKFLLALEWMDDAEKLLKESEDTKKIEQEVKEQLLILANELKPYKVRLVESKGSPVRSSEEVEKEINDLRVSRTLNGRKKIAQNFNTFLNQRF